MTRVLPLPAPAKTTRGAPTCSTAAICSGLRPCTPVLTAKTYPRASRYPKQYRRARRPQNHPMERATHRAMKSARGPSLPTPASLNGQPSQPSEGIKEREPHEDDALVEEARNGSKAAFH